MERIRITWKKSWIGCPQDQRATIRSLGLRRLQQTVEHNATPAILGMVRSVQHLVKAELVSG